MADHIEAVKKYVDSPDEPKIDKIVKYCGIALRNRDSSMVSASDRKELDTVRDGFAKKKLELDARGRRRGHRQGVRAHEGRRRQEPRVAFYYLLAEETGTLDKFG